MEKSELIAAIARAIDANQKDSGQLYRLKVALCDQEEGLNEWLKKVHVEALKMNKEALSQAAEDFTAGEAYGYCRILNYLEEAK